MKVKNYFKCFFLGAVLFAIGLLIFIYNDAFLKIVVVCTGLGVLAGGIESLITAAGFEFSVVSKKLSIIRSIVAIVIGIIAVFAPLFAAETAFTIVIYILALNLVFSAIVSVENAIAEKKNNKDMPVGRFYAEAAISLIMAIILFANPQSILATVVKIIGILAAAVGIIFVVIGVKLRRKSKLSE